MLIKFLDKEHSEKSLNAMSMEELVELRNLVAENLGLARMKNSFKDIQSAVAATWAVLMKYNESFAEEGGPEPKVKATKEPKAKVARVATGGIPKCRQAQKIERPNKAMFAQWKWLVDPMDATAMKGARPDQVKFFVENPKARIVDALEAEDVNGDLPRWWADISKFNPPKMEIVEVTDEEYETLLEQWYAAKGIEDPKKKIAEEKAKASAEAAAKAEAKAKKAEEAAAAKAAKAAAKAAKAPKTASEGSEEPAEAAAAPATEATTVAEAAHVAAEG